MPIRTTHYTCTITDIALLLGRSYRHGVDKSKATVLTTTVVLFGGGAAAVGVLIGTGFVLTVAPRTTRLFVLILSDAANPIPSATQHLPPRVPTTLFGT